MIEHISHKRTLIALLATVLYAAGASADDVEAQKFSFSGFGTLGVVHSSERQADFTSSILKPNGAGYSHAWSAGVDSLIGGQVTANFTPKLSAVLQVISEQNYDNSYRPHVEWANIKYQLTPDSSVRVGRIVLPTLLFSDTRKVAYTYPWVRPPLEVYRQAPVTSSDGVDASYQMRIGDLTNILQARYGKLDRDLPNNTGNIKARHAWGLTYTGEYHALTVHISYEPSHITLDSTRPIFDAFRQFGPQGIAIADKYNADNRAIYVTTLGARYDPGQWFVMGEAAQLVTHSFIGKGTGWYLSGGYRHGKFTPYITYGEARADNLSDPGLNLSSLPPPLIGPAAGLNAALNSLLSLKPVQNTLSIGGRWDFAKNAALKLQYDHTRIGAGSSGVLSNLQPGFQPGGKVNVFSATMDFVF
ncbi:MAG: porin [Burkholderiales bacterium]|nr:porin [Burkholderiales bacterium]